MTKIINVRKKRRKRKLSNVLFDIFLYTFLILVAAVTLVPFLQVLTISMSPQSVVAKSGLHLIPVSYTHLVIIPKIAAACIPFYPVVPYSLRAPF